MAFKRIGTCNMCGECCGYPRSTDGGQNNAWPTDWPDSIANWNQEDIESNLPVFKLVGHPAHGGEKSGTVQIQNKNLTWKWKKDKGLCKSDTNLQCPFLSRKLQDDTVPCLLYNTEHKYIWDELCQPVPPDKLETQEQVDKWFKNCPSCSYEYIEE